MEGDRRGAVRLLEEDPALGKGLDKARLERALQRSLVPAVEVAVGEWFPPADAPDEVMGVLVLEGLIARWVELGGQTSADVLGRGDLIMPFASVTDELGFVPSRVTWQVLEPARVAVLDQPFHDAMLEHARVVLNLLGRVSRRELVLSQRLAMTEAPLPERLLFTLWQVARRYGRVDASGGVVPFDLSDELLAGLAAADRSAVGPALEELERDGHVTPRGAAGWRLHSNAPPR